MELSTAIQLIEKGILKSSSQQHWVDLGAGEGLFTRALASMLPINSSVLAIDQNANTLRSIDWNYKSILLQTQVGNFISADWGGDFDGIVIANALHYVNNQSDFLSNLKNKLVERGGLIVVEYERTQPNTWVPYPIDFRKLNEMGTKAGFSSILRLGEVPSIYDGVMIYSALLM